MMFTWSGSKSIYVTCSGENSLISIGNKAAFHRVGHI